MPIRWSGRCNVADHPHRLPPCHFENKPKNFSACVYVLFYIHTPAAAAAMGGGSRPILPACHDATMSRRCGLNLIIVIMVTNAFNDFNDLATP